MNELSELICLSCAHKPVCELQSSVIGFRVQIQQFNNENENVGIKLKEDAISCMHYMEVQK